VAEELVRATGQGIGGRNSDEVEGTVEEPLPNGMFRVRLVDGRTTLCHLARLTQRLLVRVLPGDRVGVEISKFDAVRGRITRRLD
jgi:translation initiation factor IF-1